MTPALRRRVLREWQPFANGDAFTARPAAPLNQLVPRVMKGLGLEKRLHESQILYRWAEIVGAPIARFAQPYSLRHGKLEVHVEHPGYIQELRPHKSLMLQKLWAVVDKNAVRDIVFRVG